MIGDQDGGDIDSDIKVCTNGVASHEYLTKSDVTTWTPSSKDIYSDHAPIRYEYTIDDKSGVVTCSSTSETGVSTTSKGTRSIRFVTWNIAYQMRYLTTKGGEYYTSKFYCSKATTDPCKEEDGVYKKRLTNILNAVDNIMQKDKVDYVLLQECEKWYTTSPNAIQNIANGISGFTGKYDVLNFSYNVKPSTPPGPQVKINTEFCLIVKKSTPSDIQVFNFRKDVVTQQFPTPMSKYISEKFSSYLVTFQASNPYPKLDFFDRDIISVMCYVIPPTKTIFFNVHFPFGDLNPIIWQRQKQIYDFMNAIVDIIRSIPSTNNDLYEYQNYDIVFSGDFNVNILQRFPQGIKYPDGKLMEPYFFKCLKVPTQKTIISTTQNNSPSAFGQNSNTKNYNTTNIDFSVLYPAVVQVAPVSAAPASPPTSSLASSVLVDANNLVEKKYINEFFDLGIPMGCGNIQRDRYEIFILDDDNTMKSINLSKQESENADTIKLGIKNEAGTYLQSVVSGSFLFFYDDKKNVSGKDLYKVWFPYTSNSAMCCTKDNYTTAIKMNAFNPQGNAGRIIWIPLDYFSDTHSFNPDEKKKIETTIQECKNFPDKVYKDLIIQIFSDFLSIYANGTNPLSQTMKDSIKKLLPILGIDVPADFHQYPEMYDSANPNSKHLITPARTADLDKIIKELQKLAQVEAQGGGGINTNKRHTLKNSKLKSRKIKKLALRSISTTNVTKKQFNLKHIGHNKKHKTRRHKH